MGYCLQIPPYRLSNFLSSIRKARLELPNRNKGDYEFLINCANWTYIPPSSVKNLVWWKVSIIRCSEWEATEIRSRKVCLNVYSFYTSLFFLLLNLLISLFYYFNSKYFILLDWAKLCKEEKAKDVEDRTRILIHALKEEHGLIYIWLVSIHFLLAMQLLVLFYFFCSWITMNECF